MCRVCFGLDLDFVLLLPGVCFFFILSLPCYRTTAVSCLGLALTISPLLNETLVTRNPSMVMPQLNNLLMLVVSYFYFLLFIVLCCDTFSRLVLRCLVLSCVVLCCLEFCCLVLFLLVLSSHILSCLVLFCYVLSCLVLP